MLKIPLRCIPMTEPGRFLLPAELARADHAVGAVAPPWQRRLPYYRNIVIDLETGEIHYPSDVVDV